MERERDGLDELVLAMAHWLEAAALHGGDPAAGSRSLDQARHWLAAAGRFIQQPSGRGGAPGCSAPPRGA